MPNENSPANTELIQRVVQARDLLDKALALAKKGAPKRAGSKTAPATKATIVHAAIDFSMPIRAFVKKYGTDMNGAKKFTLLVAYLTKGDPAKNVALAVLGKH